VNPTAIDPAVELRRYHYKVEAGAEFAVTQLVFEPAAVRDFAARIADHRIPIIAGIWVFDSARNAEYLANEVPGVRVPPELVDRMRAAEERGQAVEEGVAIARDIVRALEGVVQGIQIGAPGTNLDALLGVMTGLA
jgi:homocysteine S-methyltransferase